MEHNTEMRVPVRSAPPPPVQKSTQPYSRDNWEQDLFGDDMFSSNQPTQKRKPPPRPPPPKIDRTTLPKPDIPSRPAHFNRKPTILSSLMNKKSKPVVPPPVSNNFKSHLVSPPMMKPEINSTNALSLIDFSSPPSSPTLTTRSSSDGLSVDSFGSDITSSTGNGTPANVGGGCYSQAESGFEDDFDLMSSMSSPKTVQDSEGNQDTWAPFDPFSPPLNNPKPKVNRPVYDSEFLDPLCNGKNIVPVVQTNKMPTIIRPKPARPKPPKASSLIATNIDNKSFQSHSNQLPNQDSRIDKKLENGGKIFEDGNYSPPMPSIPPPPPPPEEILENADSTVVNWTLEEAVAELAINDVVEGEEPFGIALYDFVGTQDDDLPFKAGDKIRLLKKLNDEWYHGKVRSGIEGMFPINYLDVKVPLEGFKKVDIPPPAKPKHTFVASVLYDFFSDQEGDLSLIVGCQVNVIAKINDEWLYGRMGPTEGQFPRSYVSDVPIDKLETKQ